MSVTIHTGDVLEGLRKIQPDSVQTCITSPPYYGLRDYGTAVWEGGAADCRHLKGSLASEKSTLHRGLAETEKLRVNVRQRRS